MRRFWPLLVAFGALAHDVAHPKREALRLSRERLELIVDSEVPAGPRARELRETFSGAALQEHLVRLATLRTRLSVDGAPVQLTRAAVVADKLDYPQTSDALLAVRVTLRAQWPAGSGDWRGRRRVLLEDEDPSGHVPVEVFCEACTVPDASSGVPDEHDARVRGAQTPLTLKVKL